MANGNGGNRRVLGVFTLAMINVAAIATLKNFPTMAEYGLSLIFYFVVASIIFFIPTSLISAELATGWPQTGGVYVWVKEGLGAKLGFLAIWLWWFENVIWYPTILAFTASTVAYVFDPALAANKFFTLAVVLIAFWGGTLINLKGMKASGIISTVGVIAGTIIPGALVITLGIVWLATGGEIQIGLSAGDLVPDITKMGNMTYLVAVLLAVAGMEMSAVHAQEVKNPQRDYPKAILLSAIVILAVTVLGSLAIAFVVPKSSLSLTAGVMEAFEVFFGAYHIKWIVPVVAILIALGGLATMSTWIVGPSKGLLATAKHGDLPPIFAKVNKNHMPIPLLILQGVIVTGLALVFLLMPSVSASYWILTALTAQQYLILYILMFAAAIRLRYTQPDVPRAYRIPFGNFGMWAVGGIGIVGALFAITVGFFPPAGSDPVRYVGFLVLGLVGTCLIGLIIHLLRKPEWKRDLGPLD